MANLQARLLRETSPDSHDYVLPGDSSKTRNRITRARKLPVTSTSTPVTRATVKVTQDIEVTDATGALLRIQPILIDVEVSIPVGAEKSAFITAFDNAVGAARAQLDDMYQGLLPGDSFTFAPEKGA